MKKEAFIFDLDGVLVFTDHLHYIAWKKMADRIGVYFDEEINNRLRGVSRMDSLSIILENSSKIYSTAEMTDLAEEKNNYYRDALRTLSPSDVDAAVRDTLKELHRRSFKLAIGSSSKNTKYILEKTGLISFFDAISDGTNISKSKPDPEVFLKAAEYLRIAPEKCVVVEDAASGIKAAKAGHMTAVGIGDAASYPETDYPIQSLTDLLSLSF